MKTALREIFNTLSLPLMVAAEWAQVSKPMKDLCNIPIEKIGGLLGTDYDPDFIANHVGTAAGAYLFAHLEKHLLNLQDTSYYNVSFRESLLKNRNSVQAAFASVACVSIMETWQMLERSAPFDWADFNSSIIAIGLFFLVNRPCETSAPSHELS